MARVMASRSKTSFTMMRPTIIARFQVGRASSYYFRSQNVTCTMSPKLLLICFRMSFLRPMMKQGVPILTICPSYGTRIRMVQSLQFVHLVWHSRRPWRRAALVCWLDWAWYLVLRFIFGVSVSPLAVPCKSLVQAQRYNHLQQ